MTLDKYPELVDYIGDIPFTDLIIMHALNPFEKHGGDGPELLPPVKHSMFYFRDDEFLDKLNDSQKKVYTSNGVYEDDFVRELKLAMAKDIIVTNKREFDSTDVDSHINIRKYDGIWDDNLNLKDVINRYSREYASVRNLPEDAFDDIFDKLNVDDYNGSFADFKCENKDLKDIIIEDFLNELKLEF